MRTSGVRWALRKGTSRASSIQADIARGLERRLAAPPYRMHPGVREKDAVACNCHNSENPSQTRPTRQDRLAGSSPPPTPASHDFSLRLVTQPHLVPSFLGTDTMLAPRRRNRYSWLFPRAKKNLDMDNEQATFWLSQFIGKNLRIHASDGRVFGGQMKCTDKVGG